MPQHRVRRRISGGMPFQPEELSDRDLARHFPDFSQGRPILWGLALGALSNSWNEHTIIRGQDWQAEFYPPKQLKLPHPSEKRVRVSWKAVPRHCCLISVRTTKSDMNEARDVGRPAVRSILALIRREIPILLPAEILWEGAIVAVRSDHIRMSTAPQHLELGRPAGATRLYRVGLNLAQVSVVDMPPQLSRALEWLILARAASVPAERFMHLWLAVLTFASYKQPKRLKDMVRIRRYTRTMTTGVAGVRSQLSVAELNERFRRAEKVRHALVHRADDSGITGAFLTGLEDSAFELVDFELAKIGMPITL